jgi:hypothetical protein
MGAQEGVSLRARLLIDNGILISVKQFITSAVCKKTSLEYQNQNQIFQVVSENIINHHERLRTMEKQRRGRQCFGILCKIENEIKRLSQPMARYGMILPMLWSIPFPFNRTTYLATIFQLNCFTCGELLVALDLATYLQLGPDHRSPLRVSWRLFSIQCIIMHACL